MAFHLDEKKIPFYSQHYCWLLGSSSFALGPSVHGRIEKKKKSYLTQAKHLPVKDWMLLHSFLTPNTVGLQQFLNMYIAITAMVLVVKLPFQLQSRLYPNWITVVCSQVIPYSWYFSTMRIKNMPLIPSSGVWWCQGLHNWKEQCGLRSVGLRALYTPFELDVYPKTTCPSKNLDLPLLFPSISGLFVISLLIRWCSLLGTQLTDALYI